MTGNDQNNNPDDLDNTFNDDTLPTSPQRHGCVTAWLILMLILNSLIAIVYIFKSGKLAQTVPSNALIALVIMGIINVICAVMLLRWKKIGFYGFAITAVITIFINLHIGISPIRASLGFAGFLILYGILQIKKDGVSAWSYLK
jgi:hypothetical protein